MDERSTKADRAPRTRDCYLTEVDSGTYWELMDLLLAEDDGYCICSEPTRSHAHTADGEYEWIAPLLEIEVGQ